MMPLAPAHQVPRSVAHEARWPKRFLLTPLARAPLHLEGQHTAPPTIIAQLAGHDVGSASERVEHQVRPSR